MKVMSPMKAHQSMRTPTCSSRTIENEPPTTRAQENAVTDNDDAATTTRKMTILSTRRQGWSGHAHTLRRWTTAGLAAAVVGTMALVAVPSAGAAPTVPQINLITGNQGGKTVTTTEPQPADEAQISPSYVGYDPTTGDEAVASTVAGSTYVYLIAGGNSESINDYGIGGLLGTGTGSLTQGDAYLVAGTGTSGLVGTPGAPGYPGQSPSAAATSNPISPQSVAFDQNGNILIAGASGGYSAVQVVAATSGTFYGVSMTAGDLYTIADVGVAGAPDTAIPMGNVAVGGFGLTVDAQGDIIDGGYFGAYFLNEQGSALSLYGTTEEPQTSTLVAGSGSGAAVCDDGVNSAPATGGPSAVYLNDTSPYVDASGNIYLADNELGTEPGVGSGLGCVWVLPAQSGTVAGQSVTAGNVYKVAGNGGSTATADGTAAIDANVATTTDVAMDPVGNLVLAVQGAAGSGASPALRVVAESNGTYYGQTMVAGDIYTIAGGSATGTTIPGDASAYELAGPTSVVSDGLGDLYVTDGATATANLYEITGGPTPPVAPSITTQPNSQTVNAGTPVTFTAAASGNPTPTVQWQSEPSGSNSFTNISGATSASYTFTPTSANNGTEFQAVFTNSVNSATTNAATLTVDFAPSITTQPNSQTVNAGTPVTFTAAASGNPTPTVQWQSEPSGSSSFTNISGATSTSYTFTPAATDNGTKFQAVFTNSVNSATTSAATLTVDFAPSITTQPTSQNTVSGTPVTFTAAASGNPTPTVQWQSEPSGSSSFTNISGATSPSYTFTPTLLDNGTKFQAVFTNSVNSATTNAATLTVQVLTVAPIITTQPTSRTVNAGTPVTFTAAASGTPTPTVQWQSEPSGSSSFTNISGATSPSYTFTPAATDNGTKFQAVFTNSVNSATTSAATLTVDFAPSITTQPNSQTVNAGTPVTFTAAASGNPTPTVQWQSEPSGSNSFTNISGATSPSYTFTPTSANNGTEFQAVFTNSVNSATTNAATLTVDFAPTVTTQPTSQTVNAGTPVTFTAAASGTPTPTVQWQSEPSGSNSFTNISGATSPSYTFTPTSANNGTKFQAVFTNSVNSATTNAATLTVDFAPTVTTQPTSRTTVSGTAVTFTAAASGTPTPTVQWQSEPSGSSSFTNISGATSASYTFTPTSANNGTKFQAVFTNSVNSATTNAATLTVDFAPTVTTQPTSRTTVSGTAVTFTAAASGNPTPTVQWQSEPSGSSSFTNISGATSASYTFTPTSANNGTKFQAVFTNSVNSATTSAATLTVPPTSNQGYWMVGADGGIFTFGDAGYYGSEGGQHLNAPIVGMAATPDGKGYWLVASDGGIFTFGDAGYYGSEGGQHLNAPIVGMAVTPDGKGYWLVASDGGIFTFGDAAFDGSEGGQHLNAPIVGMAVTPDGKGYWLVASDGGIFTFGDAAFDGSEGGQHLNQPIVGMAVTPDGKGYWLVASDGGIFTFGDAAFDGSEGGQHLNAPIVGMAATPDGKGYWLVASDGGIFTFGDAAFDGSEGGQHLNALIVGAVGTPSGS